MKGNQVRWKGRGLETSQELSSQGAYREVGGGPRTWRKPQEMTKRKDFREGNQHPRVEELFEHQELEMKNLLKTLPGNWVTREDRR